MQKFHGNVEVDGHGIAVAISCHICHANVPKARQKRNPFLDITRLRLHYLKVHPQDVDAKGMSNDVIFNICKKVKISQDDFDRILREEVPLAESLLPVSGQGMLASICATRPC